MGAVALGAMVAACDSGGGGGSSSGSIGSTVVACGTTPVAGVAVKVSTTTGTALPQYDTTTNGAGRWQIAGLPLGTYHLEFLPPPAGANDPTFGLPELAYEVVVAQGENDFQTVFLPPILANLTFTTESAVEQAGLTFQDKNGNDPLPGLSLTVPANTGVIQDGVEVAAGTPFELQVALVSPEQVPMPFLDEDDQGRTNQLFFSLQPAGARFVEVDGAGVPTGNPSLIQVTYPNVNGLADGTQVDLFRFDHESFDWVSAGMGTVVADLVVPNAGAGLPEAGWHGPPGPPPPTTDIIGQLTLNGLPFEREDIVVVTNNGFFAFTDASGRFTIDDVPLIGGATGLMCLAYTDLTLNFEVASSGPVVPTPPLTICDIDFQMGTALDDVAPTVTSKVPAGNATDVDRAQPVTLAFSEKMNALTLGGALEISDPLNAPVPFELVVQETATLAGPVTVAFLVPSPSWPDSTRLTVEVGTAAEDLNGNGLASAFRSSFTTGTSTSAAASVIGVEPQSGPAETLVVLTGVNLDQLAPTALTFDGVMTGFTLLSPNAIRFEVPVLADVSAGEKMIVVGTQTFPFALLPRITRIDPALGFPGSQVDIQGNNFEAAGANTAITFNTTAVTSVFGGNAQSLTVLVPERASSGAVVLEALGGFASGPFFFTITAPPDLFGPFPEESDPEDFSFGVPVTQTVRVAMSEQVTLDSSLCVFDGKTQLAGTTSVRASGGRGILEFTPESHFPISTQLCVEGRPDKISDLAGNPVQFTFTFCFTTAASAPANTIQEVQFALQSGNLRTASTLLASINTEEARFYRILVDFLLTFDREGAEPDSDISLLLADLGLFDGLDLFDPDPLPDMLPGSSPTSAEFRAFLRDNLLPAVDTAITGLGQLSAGFVSLFKDSGSGTTTELDRTDVLAFRTGLQFLQVKLHLLLSFEHNVDFDALEAQQDLGQDLEPNADFLVDPSFLTQRDADLTSARTALRNAVNSFNTALNSLLAESDEQADDFIFFEGEGFTDEEIQMDIEAQMLAAEELRAELNRIRAALDAPQTLDDHVIDLRVGPVTTFELRGLLPTFVDGREFPALAPLPADALDLNGVLMDGVTQEQAADALDLLVPFDGRVVADGALTVDGLASDWIAAGVIAAVSDPLAPDDPDSSDLFGEDDDFFEGELEDAPNRAVDVTRVFIADDASDYLFRIDFDGGTPSTDNFYSFSLTPNLRGSTEPVLEGLVSGFDTLSLFVESPFGPVPVLGPDETLVEAGSGRLEFRIPKANLKNLPGGLDVDDQAEYVFEFESGFQDFFLFVFASDDVAPVRLIMNLP